MEYILGIYLKYYKKPLHPEKAKHMISAPMFKLGGITDMADSERHHHLWCFKVNVFLHNKLGFFIILWNFKSN